MMNQGPSDQDRSLKSKVGLIYDEEMLKHRNVQEFAHPETPERISGIYSALAKEGLLQRCEMLPSRKAIESELLLIHSSKHILAMKATQSAKSKQLRQIETKSSSVYFNKFTYQSATLAAGSVLEIVDNVVKGNCASGVAIVRPPGHHAEEGKPCGFCIFNNVALAAKYAIQTRHLDRILILDWDLHHGNGIQHLFESDPRVLYISIHQYNNATFFPCSTDANYDSVGAWAGTGFTINIPWNKAGMSDAEYLAVFKEIVIPIGKQFEPQLVLVAAGFDAARGDPLGKSDVTPEGFGLMTNMLSSLAKGKVILVLEGGYNVESIAQSMVQCTKALLGDDLPQLELKKQIDPAARQTINDVVKTHSKYWKLLMTDEEMLLALYTADSRTLSLDQATKFAELEQLELPENINEYAWKSKSNFEFANAIHCKWKGRGKLGLTTKQRCSFCNKILCRQRFSHHMHEYHLHKDKTDTQCVICKEIFAGTPLLMEHLQKMHKEYSQGVRR